MTSKKIQTKTLTHTRITFYIGAACCLSFFFDTIWFVFSFWVRVMYECVYLVFFFSNIVPLISILCNVEKLKEESSRIQMSRSMLQFSSFDSLQWIAFTTQTSKHHNSSKISWFNGFRNTPFFSTFIFVFILIFLRIFSKKKKTISCMLMSFRKSNYSNWKKEKVANADHGVSM